MRNLMTGKRENARSPVNVGGHADGSSPPAGSLEAVFLMYRVPVWGTALGSRTVKHLKVHMTDSGIPPGEDCQISCHPI
jgi:hypothetical protein